MRKLVSRVIFSEIPFDYFVVAASDFKSAGGRGRFFGFGGAGTTFGGQAGPAQQFMLGGLLCLSAFGRDEFRGDHFAYGGAGYLYRVGGSVSSLFIKRTYVDGWYEGGSAFLRAKDASYFNDGAGALIVETPLGPLTVGGALGTGGRGKAFFSFGRFF